MRCLYIVPLSIAQGYVHLFLDSHYQTLPNGQVLLSVRFHDELRQDKFEAVPGVEPLPHAYDPTPLSDEHVEKLKHLGVQKGHTAKDLRKSAKQVNPLL